MSFTLNVPSFVKPEDPDDQQRWDESSLRVRMLTGNHEEDVLDSIGDTFSDEISAQLEINPDMSANPFAQTHNELSTAYDEPYVVTVEEDPDLSTIVTTRLLAQMPEVELYTRAVNETLIRLDWPTQKQIEDGAIPEVRYRHVTADMVVIEFDPINPDQPIKVEELRLRKAEGEAFWTWDVWDLSGDKPVFRIDEVVEEGEGKDKSGSRVDATAKFAPELVGVYPYLDKDDNPILPYVLYHRRVSNCGWHWLEGIELRAGALRLAALWTHWGDGFVDASHPQRYGLDVQVQAGVTDTVGGVQVDRVPVDRKSILMFRSNGAAGATGTLSQFQASFEPLESVEALKRYEERLAIYAGLSPSDLQVTTQQSGYAIVVSREGKRRAQRKIVPALRASDQLTLSKAAKLSNANMKTDLPEDPAAYSIAYTSIGKSVEEMVKEFDLAKKQFDAGIIDEITFFRRAHPEIQSDEEAIERIIAVAERQASLTALKPTPIPTPPPTVPPPDSDEEEKPDE